MSADEMLALLRDRRRSAPGERSTPSLSLPLRIHPARASALGWLPEPFALTLRLPALWTGVAAFLLVAGLELSAGQWIYSLFTESRGVSATGAAAWTSGYWASFTDWPVAEERSIASISLWRWPILFAPASQACWRAHWVCIGPGSVLQRCCFSDSRSVRCSQCC